MDHIKEAFGKVRQDIDSLKYELNNLKSELTETRQTMIEICEIVKEFYNEKDQTDNQINSTYRTDKPTDNSLFKPLKPQNMGISKGNGGVPTDRQTDRQTNRQTQKSTENNENSIDNALELLDSLDNIKKEIRLKFKRLTEKELLVFSTLYQITDEQGHSDYKTLSDKLNLTESSIRDYIGKLIKKGIPVDKIKLNNKNIQLSISPNLKKIASLSTILKLREI